MLKNTKINLLIDSKDLTCPICYLPFGIEENLPISLNCGHTICSECIRRLDKCAICKAPFHNRQSFNKSILISSLLESSSRVKKCAFHQKPFEGFCLQKKKLVCFDCLVDKKEAININDIEEKVEELQRLLIKAQEYSLFEVEKFLETKRENFKKCTDNLLQEETCYALLLKERLYKEIQGLIILKNPAYQDELSQENLTKWLKKTEIMLEKWRSGQQDGDVAVELLETKLEMKSDMDSLLKTFAESKRVLTEKQNSFLAEIQNHQNLIKCLSKKFQRAFEGSPEDLERCYLTEVFKELGLIFKPYGSNLCFENHQLGASQVMFNPLFFDCRIKTVTVRYSQRFDSATLAILGQVLENISTLESFNIVLKELSEPEFCLISISLLQVKNLKEFAVGIQRTSESGPLLKKLGDHLGSLKWFTRFYFQHVNGSCFEVLRAKLRGKFRVLRKRALRS